MTARAVALRTEVRRLCAATARSRSHPLDVIDWDDPAMQVDPTDARWRTGVEDPAVGSAWFARLPDDQRATYCLERICLTLLVGIEFETQLALGLHRLLRQPGLDAAVAAYLYEEIVEETQHSLMFRTFVERCRPELLDEHAHETATSRPGRPSSEEIAASVVRLAGREPALLLCTVLCGEDPIDLTQREILRGATGPGRIHPLLRQVCELHIREEARHLRFARTYLTYLVATGPPGLRRSVMLFLPSALDRMTRYLLSTPEWFVRRWEIPDEELQSPGWRERDRLLRLRAARRVVRFARLTGFADDGTRALWHPIDAGDPAKGDVA